MKNQSQWHIVLTIFVLAVSTRIAIPFYIGHPPNFSPIDAIALFSGAYFSRWLIACAVVICSVWVGDLFINHLMSGHWQLFYPGFYWQYASYLLITGIGVLLKNQVRPFKLLMACFSASILFFIISNFGVWCSGLLYPLNWQGLITCYVAAIPFFKNTLFSDLFFTMILFSYAEYFYQEYRVKKSYV